MQQLFGKKRPNLFFSFMYAYSTHDARARVMSCYIDFFRHVNTFNNFWLGFYQLFVLKSTVLKGQRMCLSTLRRRASPRHNNWKNGGLKRSILY